MRISNEEVQKYIHGALSCKTKEGFYCPVRFTGRQFEENKIHSVKILQAETPSGIRFECITDATEVIFDLGISQNTHPRKPFALKGHYFDLLVNDDFYSNFMVPNSEVTTGYAQRTFSCKLPEGKKKISLYLPVLLGYAYIKEIEFKNVCICKPVKYNRTILFHGDSITQGARTIFPSRTYVANLSRALKADFVNQAISGEVFYPEIIEEKPDFTPYMIYVAYGTNNFSESENKTRENFDINCPAFFKKLHETFPTVPTVVQTPIWRGDLFENCTDGDKRLEYIREVIRKETSKYNNMHILEGEDLVPHCSDFFADEVLHPNDSGFSIYSSKVITQVKKIIKNNKRK